MPFWRLVTMLIETSNPGHQSLQHLKSKLHNQVITSGNLDQIILTHIHIDHAGTITSLKEKNDILIFIYDLPWSW
ncbi:MAG: MBL fold metallo-hydrolase [Bacillus sp. (in: Bacteria)]|nr:MBL fold metallo-hydrolase [Bacillus sp. (in: firmicutes)]